MEIKRQPTAESDGSILSDLDQMNLADFAFDEFEVNSNDGTEEIEKVELMELKKEMEVMKLASKADSNEIANKLDGKIEHLEKYHFFQFHVNEGQENRRKQFKLPEAIGEIVVQQEKVFVPTKQFPEYNFVGRILGPRGMTAKQLEAETGCKIMVRGRGSMKDKKQEDVNRGKPNWEHLSEELHVCIQSEDTPNRNAVKIARAIKEVNKLLVPQPEGKDELKRKQLRELAIINGTFRNGIKKEIGQKDHKIISQAKIITLEELENKIVGLKQTNKAMDQQSAPIEDFANLKMWDGQQSLPPVNAKNSTNAKPTKAPTVLENVNTTELKKAISNLFGYCAGCEQGFLMNDWARQVGDLQYHVRCFKCGHCHRRLFTNEEFVQDSKIQRKNRALGKMVPRILCKKDHIYLALKNKPTQMGAEKVGDPVAKNPYRKWQID